MKQTYSNCCGAETNGENGQLIMCRNCKEWAVAETEETDYWYYAQIIVVLLGAMCIIDTLLGNPIISLFTK